MPKQTVMTTMSAITKASSARKPRLCRARIKSTSRAVSTAPSTSGMPKRSFSAMAVPMTSARSQAMIASSQISQRGNWSAGR